MMLYIDACFSGNFQSTKTASNTVIGHSLNPYERSVDPGNVSSPILVTWMRRGELVFITPSKKVYDSGVSLR